MAQARHATVPLSGTGELEARSGPTPQCSSPTWATRGGTQSARRSRWVTCVRGQIDRPSGEPGLRDAEDTGLRNLLLESFGINAAWLAVVLTTD